MFKKEKSVLPGFGLTMGITITLLSLVVLIPLSTLLVTSSALGWGGFMDLLRNPRVLSSLSLSFGASFLAALVNTIFGLIIAWVLVRYSFPGRKILDGLVDLPFALPTAVAGITLTTLYARNGWFGKPLSLLGIDVAFTPLGVFVALTFIGLPFVVRTVQPVLEDLDLDMEEAAATLGASRWTTWRHVVLPVLYPSLMTGFTLSFARALGEYGSVVFISGNMPLKTEITPLFIMSKLEQFDYVGATGIAVIMLGAAFVLLLLLNVIQWWNRSRQGLV